MIYIQEYMDGNLCKNDTLRKYSCSRIGNIKTCWITVRCYLPQVPVPARQFACNTYYNKRQQYLHHEAMFRFNYANLSMNFIAVWAAVPTCRVLSPAAPDFADLRPTFCTGLGSINFNLWQFVGRYLRKLFEAVYLRIDCIRSSKTTLHCASSGSNGVVVRHHLVTRCSMMGLLQQYHPFRQNTALQRIGLDRQYQNHIFFDLGGMPTRLT